MQFAVNMGCLRTKWQEIPLTREMDTLHLGIGAGPLQDPVGMNIGNPHAVFFVNDLDNIDLTIYGPQLQKHPLFIIKNVATGLSIPPLKRDKSFPSLPKGKPPKPLIFSLKT